MLPAPRYFEEALKMRCLLEEFRRGTPVNPTVIVGFREHIFTGSVSSLANYMALQELSFVTLGQRVLSSPLRVRMHYGHPDLFDKVFFMAAGGVSKASKGINLSEDIFAGYNGTIRGGKVGSCVFCVGTVLGAGVLGWCSAFLAVFALFLSWGGGIKHTPGTE